MPQVERVQIPKKPEPLGGAPPDELPSGRSPGQSASVDRREAGPWTVILRVASHAEDALRFIESLRSCGPDGHNAALSVVTTEGLGEWWPDDTRLSVWVTGSDAGWARTVNFGLARVSEPLVLVADTSIEFRGDLPGALGTCLSDESVGMAGPFGLTTPDGFEFEEATGGEVDALQGYAIGLRRDALGAIGPVDPFFRFYRNGDIDWSLRARRAGFRIAASGADLVLRHPHREWEALEPSEQEVKSRRNFSRILETFGRPPLP